MTKITCQICSREFTNPRGLHVHYYDAHNGPPISREELAQLYWTEGLSCIDIASRLGYSNSTIGEWLRKYKIKRRSKEMVRALTHIDKSKWVYDGESYHPNPSPHLYYILGAMLGDGGIVVYKRPLGMRYGLQLRVVDRIFAETFQKNLQEIGLRPYFYIDSKQPKRNPKWSVVYCVFANSMLFVRWYQRLDLTTIKTVLDHNPEFHLPFLRGFYEAEGSLYSNNSTHCIGITNSNEILLLLCKELLESNGFHPTFRKENRRLNRPDYYKDMFILSLSRKAEVLRFVESTGTHKLGSLRR